MNKKFAKEIDALVGYVKNNMKKDDDWVVIRYRDVPDIANVSSYYVRKLFELLKEHPNIVFEIDSEARTNKKPLKFRYVSEKEKINTSLSGDNFYYLTDDHVEYIKEKVKISDYETLFKVLSICNFAASMGADEKFVPIDRKEISNILVLTQKEVNEILNTLLTSQILVDVNGTIRLVLNEEALLDVKPQINQSVHDTNNRARLNASDLIAKLAEQQESKDDKKEDEAINESNSLLENMISFRDAIVSMQDDFKIFLSDQVNAINESDKKEEELSRGFKTLESLMDENEMLKEKNEELKSENSRLSESLKKSKKAGDQFIVNAEQRLEILLAETVNAVSEYAKIPGWQKDQAANAKFQKTILSSVTSAVDDMLNYNIE